MLRTANAMLPVPDPRRPGVDRPQASQRQLVASAGCGAGGLGEAAAEAVEGGKTRWGNGNRYGNIYGKWMENDGTGTWINMDENGSKWINMFFLPWGTNGIYMKTSGKYMVFYMNVFFGFSFTVGNIRTHMGSYGSMFIPDSPRR